MILNEQKIKVTASGNGTGLTGGRVHEGTLGIITEIMLRLIDLPKNVLLCVVF